MYIFTQKSKRGSWLDSREIIRKLTGAGWIEHSQKGSHKHFKHPERPGKITVPHPRKDLPPKTVKSILRAAGLAD